MNEEICSKLVGRLLEGVRVIEFCQVAAGPFCGMLLADFGAQVTKIEPSQGDTLRQWPPHRDGFSENFASLNRGKQSVVLDLKQPPDLALAKQMVFAADVVVENNRPGAMARLGLGAEELLREKPSLVYCSISAYGQSGPRASEGGFDLTIQAAAGVMSVTGTQGGEPVKCGVPISDFTAGLYGAFAISAMLGRVRSGGPGGHIDIPMFATTLAVSALQTSQYFGTGADPGKLGSAHPRNSPYQAYEARDGWFAIAAGNNKLWESVCDAAGVEGLKADARFASTTSRAQHQDALLQILGPQFAQAEVAHWLAELAARGVPCAPINRYSDALADFQTAHLQLVAPMVLPGGARTRTVACPLWIDGQPVRVDTRPPALGEHTDRWRSQAMEAAVPPVRAVQK